jgi:hypothetical protein
VACQGLSGPFIANSGHLGISVTIGPVGHASAQSL